MEWHFGNMKHFASTNGDDAVREVLTNYVITNGNRESSPLWKELCVKLKFCTKSTKNISLNMHRFTSNGEPYHFIRVLNGRGQYLININILDTELQQYLGE